MGTVIVLTILATLVCGGGVYTAFSGKLDDGVSAIMLLCSAMVGACARWSHKSLWSVARDGFLGRA